MKGTLRLDIAQPLRKKKMGWLVLRHKGHNPHTKKSFRDTPALLKPNVNRVIGIFVHVTERGHVVGSASQEKFSELNEVAVRRCVSAGFQSGNCPCYVTSVHWESFLETR